MRSITRVLLFLSALALWAVPATDEVQAQPAEKVDVAVFELRGDGIDEDLLDTLSGVLRQEAQQHERYALANPAAIRRDEVALVVGCDPDSAECLRQLADYVDGRVLIFGEVTERGSGLVITIDIFDVETADEPVRIARRISDISDPVVAFRREVEQIFAGLDAIDETHLVVMAPGEDIPIRLEGVEVGRGMVERQGLRPGVYRVVVGERGREIWQGDVHLQPGQLVEIRPDPASRRSSQQEPETAEMEVDKTVLGPGERSASEGTVVYEERRSNMGAVSLIGTGAVILGASGVMALMMGRVEDQIRDEAAQGTLDESRHQALIDRGENYETAHYILLGVGGAAIVTGTTWVGVNLLRDRSDRRALESGLSVAPSLRGVVISGTW